MTMQKKLQRLMRSHRASAIAAAANVSQPTLNRLTRVDGANVKVSTIRGIAAALGVDAIWLLDDARSWPPVRLSRPATDELDADAQTLAAHESAA